MSAAHKLSGWVALVLAGCSSTPEPWVTPARLSIARSIPAGTTIVFLHGAYHGSWSFADLDETMQAQGRNTARIDLRGHWGEHRVQVASDVGIADYLSDCSELLDCIPGRKVLCGHSLGAWLAIDLADRPDVEAVVAISPPTPDAIAAERWRLLLSDPIAAFCLAFAGDASGFYHDANFADRYLFSPRVAPGPREVALANIRSQHEPSRLFDDIQEHRLRAPRSARPLLLMVGELDPVAGPQTAESLAIELGADLIVWPEAGHDLMLEPDHIELTAAILGWIDDRTRRTSPD